MDTNDRYFSTKTNPIRRILMMCIPMAVILVPILIASIGHWIAILGILASAALIFGIISMKRFFAKKRLGEVTPLPAFITAWRTTMPFPTPSPPLWRANMWAT